MFAPNKIKRNGISLVELIMTIAIIAVGVLPLLASLTNLTTLALLQKDMLTGMTIGTWRMDAWLQQFQAIDAVIGPEATSYVGSTVIYPPVDKPPNVGLLSEEGKAYRALPMNDSLFRTETTFTPMDGNNGSRDLSDGFNIVYQLDVKVWKIKNPRLNETGFLDTTQVMAAPSFARGDEIVYQLSSLYSQNNRFSSVFVDQD